MSVCPLPWIFLFLLYEGGCYIIWYIDIYKCYVNTELRPWTKPFVFKTINVIWYTREIFEYFTFNCTEYFFKCLTQGLNFHKLKQFYSFIKDCLNLMALFFFPNTVCVMLKNTRTTRYGFLSLAWFTLGYQEFSPTLLLYH